MYKRIFFLLMLSLFLVTACSRKTCPPKDLSSIMWIANPKNIGDKMIISGNVYKADGTTPAIGVIIAGCHPNFSKYYSTGSQDKSFSELSGGLISGWCRTDSLGFYEIHTMRPVINNSSTTSQQVFLSLKRPGVDSGFLSQDLTLRVSSTPVATIPSFVKLGEQTVVDVFRRSDGVYSGTKNIILK